MSRSRRKIYAHAWVAGCESIKKDKIRNNKLLRRKTHQLLKNYEESSILPMKQEEVMGRWDYADDGRYVTSLEKAIENNIERKHQIIYK